MTRGSPPDSSRGGIRRGAKLPSESIGSTSRLQSHGLAGGQAGPDHARRSQRLVCGAHAPAGDEEIVHIARLETAERDVVCLSIRQVLVGCAEAAFLPQLDGPRGPSHAVLELAAGK